MRVVITSRGQLDEVWYRKLKSRVISLRAQVRAMPGNGATIHDRMQSINYLMTLTAGIGENGEYVSEGKTEYSLRMLEIVLCLYEKRYLGHEVK